MNELRGVLLRNFAAYPDMQPQDAVKLIYQNEFYVGHMISVSGSLESLERELDGVAADAGVPLTEDIGNGICRLNLAAAKADTLSARTVNRMFVNSATPCRGSMRSFEKKLDVLASLCDAGAAPFDGGAAYIDGYRRSGCPAVSHSAAYRERYRPAYRLILREYAEFIALIAAIDAALAERGRVCAAIDGCCGSGKSSLAALLSSLYDCNVIRMDDFFLPPGLRTPQRYDTPGGNVHHERFVEEAAAGIMSGGPFRYRVFDCSVLDYTDTVYVTPKPLTVVEGSYSMHPEIRKLGLYDITVFLGVGEKEQKRRIAARSGDMMLEMFTSRWIPLENRYFEAAQVRQACMFTFETDTFTPPRV